MDPDEWDAIGWYRDMRYLHVFCALRSCQHDPQVLGVSQINPLVTLFVALIALKVCVLSIFISILLILTTTRLEILAFLMTVEVGLSSLSTLF